jgi:hypothetical protein
MLAVEGIWLLTILVNRKIEYRDRVRTIVIAGLAMLAGIVILAPALYVAYRVGREVLASGKMEWLTGPPWWEPFAFFNKATGSVAFPVLLALAAWGVWRGWRDQRGALEFTLLLMWGGPLLLVIGSSIWRPMFLERYALYSFPAFFILIALGTWQLGSNFSRIAATGLVVILAFGHIHSYFRKTHDIDWQEAARVAQASLRPDETVAVTPAYAVEVVRYYSSPLVRGHAVGDDAATASSAVAILAEQGVNAAAAARVHREYPHVLARERGVVVLSR